MKNNLKTLRFSTGRYSTCVQKCTIKEAKWFGRFYIVGSIPATCMDPSRNGSKSYATEADAIEAILADPWIKATPDQTIQGFDCRKIERAAYGKMFDEVLAESGGRFVLGGGK